MNFDFQTSFITSYGTHVALCSLFCRGKTFCENCYSTSEVLTNIFVTIPFHVTILQHIICSLSLINHMMKLLK